MSYIKDFAPFEQAVELKELGFDEPCFKSYSKDGSFVTKMWQEIECDAPTFSQAFRFFREKHQLTSWIYNSDTNKFFYTILQNGRIIKAHELFINYEKAELACLIKLIEIVKNK